MKWFLFKSAAHISPQAAAGRVRAHEGEHVSNAYDKAAQKNGTVVYALFPSTPLCVRNVEKLMFQAEQRILLSAIRMRITHTRKNRKAADATILPGANFDVAV